VIAHAWNRVVIFAFQLLSIAALATVLLHDVTRFDALAIEPLPWPSAN
jgi:hypothetical protein